MFYFLLILTTLTIADVSRAQEHYLIEGKQGSKVEALRALINDSHANVTKCSQVELSEKATLRTKKKVKEVTSR